MTALDNWVADPGRFFSGSGPGLREKSDPDPTFGKDPDPDPTFEIKPGSGSEP